MRTIRPESSTPDADRCSDPARTASCCASPIGPGCRGCGARWRWRNAPACEPVSAIGAAIHRPASASRASTTSPDQSGSSPAYDRIRARGRDRGRAGRRRSRRRGCGRRASWRARAANEPGDGPVDVAVARLARRWLGRRRRSRSAGPARAGRRARREHPVPVGQGDDRPGLATEVAVRERQAQDDLDGLLGHEVAERRRRSDCRWSSGRYGLIGSIRMSSRAVTSSVDVAGHDLERLADLGRDGVADLRGVRDVVEVAAAGVGELLEEPLVEVVADAERRGRDAACPQFGGVAWRARRGR